MKAFLKIAAVMLAALMCLCVCACKDGKEPTETDGADGVSCNVSYNGTKISLGAKSDSIIKALGSPQDTREIGDCGGLGAMVKYSYSSLDVYVLKSKTDGNIIDQITLRDDLVTTPEGVYIGMSAETARDKLGEPTDASDTALTYKSGKYALKLTIKDANISGIDYITVTD